MYTQKSLSQMARHWVAFAIFAVLLFGCAQAPQSATPSPSVASISQGQSLQPTLDALQTQIAHQNLQATIYALQTQVANPSNPTQTSLPTDTPSTMATPTSITAPTNEPAQPVTAHGVEIFAGNASRTGEQSGPALIGKPVIRWRFDNDADPTVNSIISDVAVIDGVVYANGKFLYAVDAATGKERWRVENIGQSPPTVIDGIVYAGGQLGVRAFDATTGTQRWYLNLDGWTNTSPVVVDGIVYATDHHSNDESFLRAINAQSGNENWNFKLDGSSPQAPAVVDGTIYVAGEQVVYAIDAKTGQERWHFTQDRVDGGPSVANDMVYFGSFNGNLYAIDAKTGTQRWQFPAGRISASSPAVVNGVVYVGSLDQHLYAVDAMTGKERWRFQANDVVQSTPAVVNDTIYATSRDGTLYAINAGSGQEDWQIQTAAGDFVSSPVVVDGSVYMAGGDGNLFAISGSTESTADSPGSSTGSTDNATILDVQAIATDFAFQPQVLTAPAGQPFTVNFTNSPGNAVDGLQHSWVLVALGQEQAVVDAAAARGGDASGVAGVIAGSKPINLGHSESINVPALSASTYTYICTVPGHYPRGMKGTLNISLQTESPDPIVVMEAYDRALNDHDLDTVVNMFTDDAVVLSSNSSVMRGKAELREGFGETVRLENFKVEMKEYKVEGNKVTRILYFSWGSAQSLTTRTVQQEAIVLDNKIKSITNTAIK